jgi:hypothetical protein
MAYKSTLKHSPNGGMCLPCAVRQSNIKHGQSKGNSLYNRWCNIKQRCLNPCNPRFKDYGGRGITIHPEWLDFKTFRDAIFMEIGPCPSPEHTLDRTDNNGNYQPGNLRWSTVREQNNNQRVNRIFTLNGETHTVGEWIDIVNKNDTTIWSRLLRGWSIERALTQPVRKLSPPFSRR